MPSSKRFNHYVLTDGGAATTLAKEYLISVSIVCKCVQQASNGEDVNIISMKERDLIMENTGLKENLDGLKQATVI